MPVGVEFAHQVLETSDWQRGRRALATARGWPQQSLLREFAHDALGWRGGRRKPRRSNFGDDAAPVGHEHALARRRGAYVFAELVLECFKADGLHEAEVASGGYYVKPVTHAERSVAARHLHSATLALDPSPALRHIPAIQRRRGNPPALLFFAESAMKVRNSLKSLRSRHRDNQLVRRKGRVYIINKTQKRIKARQG